MREGGWDKCAGAMKVVFLPASDPGNVHTLDYSAGLNKIYVVDPDGVRIQIYAWSEF